MRSLVVLAWVTSLPLCAQIFSPLADFPGVARDDAASFGLDGKVYVGTGYQTGWVLASDWQAYDPMNSIWNAVALMPATPRQYATGFAIGDTGYVFGGLDANGATNELWAYLPASDSWVQCASLPDMARYACSYLGAGIIACGMKANGAPTDEMWKYDPPSDSWAFMGIAPGGPRHRAASMYSDFDSYLVGGADSAFVALKDAWMLNHLSGQWTSCADLPQGRFGAAGSYTTWGPLVAGGATDDSTFHSSGYLYNNLTPDPLGSIPYARRGAVMCSTQGIVPSGNGSYTFTGIGCGLDSSYQRRGDWFGEVIVVSVAEHGALALTVYPNPGINAFRISLPNNEEVQLTVRDARGAVVRMERTFGPTTIDMSDQPLGLYTVESLSAGFRARARWIKL